MHGTGTGPASASGSGLPSQTRQVVVRSDGGTWAAPLRLERDAGAVARPQDLS